VHQQAIHDEEKGERNLKQQIISNNQSNQLINENLNPIPNNII
jgi:hypothetical protein